MGKLIVDTIDASAQGIMTPLVDVADVNDNTNWEIRDCFPTSNPDYMNPGTGAATGYFTLAADGITVPTAGLYYSSFSCYMYSTADRENAMWAFTINGNLTMNVSKHGYIRDYDDHRHSSSTAFSLLYLNASDKVGLASNREGDSGTVQLLGAKSYVFLMKAMANKGY
tara:strand:+ start:535 stop:1038 length:504 start_codon:yes stop_codon:yes gene_type:complete